VKGGYEIVSGFKAEGELYFTAKGTHVNCDVRDFLKIIEKREFIEKSEFYTLPLNKLGADIRGKSIRITFKI